MAAPLAIGSMVATAVGGITSAFGAIQGGGAEAAMYNYRAGVAQLNRQIAQQNAEYEVKAGEVQAQEVGMKTRYEVGRIRAAQGASGLDVNKGSAADVRISQEEIGEEDQATTRANAARRAYGYEVEGMGYQAESRLDVAAGEQARTSGYIKAASSLLGGASSVADKWYQGRSVGLFV